MGSSSMQNLMENNNTRNEERLSNAGDPKTVVEEKVENEETQHPMLKANSVSVQSRRRISVSPEPL
jgi:hypothetical protein